MSNRFQFDELRHQLLRLSNISLEKKKHTHVLQVDDCVINNTHRINLYILLHIRIIPGTITLGIPQYRPIL